MQSWSGKRTIAVATAHLRADGVPDFTLNEVEVTHDDYLNGVHVDIVEAELGRAGYDEPLIHFDEISGPAFLVPAVRQYMASLNSTAQIDTEFPF